MDIDAQPPLSEYSTVALARRFRVAVLLGMVGITIIGVELLVVEHAPLPAVACFVFGIALGVAAAIGIDESTLTVRADRLVIVNGSDRHELGWDDIATIDPRHPNRNQLPIVTTTDGRNIVLKALRKQPPSVAQDLERRLAAANNR